MTRKGTTAERTQNSGVKASSLGIFWCLVPAVSGAGLTLELSGSVSQQVLPGHGLPVLAGFDICMGKEPD